MGRLHSEKPRASRDRPQAAGYNIVNAVEFGLRTAMWNSCFLRLWSDRE
jgi:hypothetical protein